MIKAMKTRQSFQWMNKVLHFWNTLGVILVLGLIVYLWLKSRGDINSKSKDIGVKLSNDIQLHSERSNSYSDVDDLTKIRGIGKKVSQILNSVGIYTYEDLSGMTTEELVRILDRENLQFMDPSDWPSQATDQIR